MIALSKNKLSIRQASYAVTAVIVITTLVFLVEVVQYCVSERQRLATTLRQQVDMVSNVAARAAFHVDDIQAATILDGLFRFENLQSARITTDLGEVLAERRREFPASFADPLARMLFSDVSSQSASLQGSEFASEERSGSKRTTPASGVGIIELRASAELAGREFLTGVAKFATGLVIQFVLLGVALVVIFHRTLTLPLLRYANAVSHLSARDTDQEFLEIPAGHEHDEFGTVVSSTNQLLERIRVQHQELLHREKVAALGSLLAGVSHELNNPLAILAAQSELLVETARDDDTRRRGEKILSMTQRCAVIVRRFLALARRREVEKERVNIGDIISEVLEILEHQLDQAGVKATVSISPDLPPVLADPSQLTQVLLNLVVNAQQALAGIVDERTLDISAKVNDQNGLVEITVADNGPGILPESEGRIFEPFYTTKSEGQGTGLGLSYAFDVARDHGGSLNAGPSTLGGAAFTIKIPKETDGHSTHQPGMNCMETSEEAF